MRNGEAPVAIRSDLAHAAHYLHQLFGVEPAPECARAMETYLNTVCDHGLNASTFTASFQSDGAKLAGSTTGPDGGEVKIADGKVDGNNVSFSITFDFGGMPFTMNYKGVVNKDQIKFTIDIFGMPIESVVKKTA